MRNYIIIAIGIIAATLTAFTTIKNGETIKSKTITRIPSVTIESLDGKSINSKSIVKSRESTLLIFWATCCAPCRKELSTISKVYDKWQKNRD